ncbi:hypothetical protein M233_01380 [Xylella fastidiosa subsp. multiplex Griffin-1]|nr:hypothetical protein M233_01380 [Xylella fastidiosa subsp. multiplex Griffin-1]
MKLYIKPGACSLADHILLRWSGSSFDLQFLDHQSMKAPEYLALNPSGAVPALQVGDWVLTQNAAILNYITDIAPAERGLSGDGSLKARAEINRWIAFSSSDVHPMYWALFGGTTYLQDPQMIARSQDNLARNCVCCTSVLMHILSITIGLLTDSVPVLMRICTSRCDGLKKSVWIFLVWMRYQRSLSVWRLIPGCRLHYRRKG